jgi:hypothetical protein
LALLAAAGLSVSAAAQTFEGPRSADEVAEAESLAPPGAADQEAIDDSVANEPLAVEPTAMEQEAIEPTAGEPDRESSTGAAAAGPASEEAGDEGAASMQPGKSPREPVVRSPGEHGSPSDRIPETSPAPGSNFPHRAGGVTGNGPRATDDAGEQAPVYDPRQSDINGRSEYEPEEVAEGGDGEFDALSFTQLISSGTWLHAGRWFTQADVTLLHRNTAQRQILTDSPLVFQGSVFFSEAMTTESAGFGYEPGMHVTIGKYLGRDDENRDRVLEFSYMGLNDYTSEHAVAAPGNATTVLQLLRTPLDRGIGAFNFSTRQAYAYESDFHSFEINAKIARRLGRDRLVLQPNGEWTRECNPGLLPSFLAGVRMISIDEDFKFEAQRTPFSNNLSIGGAPIALPAADGRYAIETSNRLFGVQVGADLVEQRCNWSFGVRSKIGGYYNFAEQSSVVRINDTAGGFTTQTRDERASDEQLTLAVELGLVGSYQLRPNVAIRGGYDFMWLQGLALAPEQLDFNAAPIPNVRTGSHHLYDGMSLGIEWVW